MAIAIVYEVPTTQIHSTGAFNSKVNYQVFTNTVGVVSQSVSCSIVGADESRTVTLFNSRKTGSGFLWNLAEVVNDSFVDFSLLFNTIDGTTKVNNNRTLFTLTPTFQDYVLEADLTLTADATAVGNAIKCLRSTVVDLSTYYNDGALLFLTAKPKGRVSKNGGSEYLSVYSDGVATCRVAFYDINGDYMEDEDISYTTTAANLNHFPIGTGNLTVPTGAKSYRVNLRESPTTLQTIVYNIVECNLHRIHFVNRFGQIDTFGFDRIQQKNSASSSSYSQPLQLSPFLDGFQYLRTDIKSNQVYTATAFRVSFEEMEWLADLVNTPFANWEVNGEYLPIEILDTETQPFSSYENDYVFSVSFRLSNPLLAVQ